MSRLNGKKGLLVEFLPSEFALNSHQFQAFMGKKVILIGEAVSGPFEVNPDDENEVVLELIERTVCGGRKYWTAYPFREDGDYGRYMHEGVWITDCDSRFPNEYPIPFHCRTEGVWGA